MSQTRRPAGRNDRRDDPRYSRGKRPPQRRKRRRRVNYRFIVFLAVLAVVAVGLGILVNYLLNKPDTDVTVNPSATPDPNSQLLSATDSAPVDVMSVSSTAAADLAELLGNQDAVIAGLTEDQQVKVEDLSITQGLSEDWMNILLLGSDARTAEESSRTDTMIICSINTRSGEVKLTSIMRDMAVTFDDIGAYNGTYRVNAANYFGGPNLAMQTINECFGMNIQYYAMVDFTSFSIIAEQLGGIDMDITEAEMEQINKNAIQQAKLAYKAGIDESALSDTNVLLTEFGSNVHLNGRQALAYARIRKIDSDFSRAERQRNVLIALMNKLKTKSAQEVMALTLTLVSYTNSNMSADQIIGVATTVLNSGVENVPQFRLPVNDSYVQQERNKQDMLYDTDWAENTKQLYNFIYE